VADLATYIIGMGNVGLGLAMALEARGLPLTGVWNRSRDRAEAASRVLRCPVDSDTISLRGAHLVIVATADDAIAELGTRLSGMLLPTGCVVTHLSGCLPASILGEVQGGGVGSMHPMLACPTPQQAVLDLPLAHWVIEGDVRAVPVLEAFVARLGARSQRIRSESKARYHAAAVMASNLVLALLRAAADEAKEAGLSGLGPALNRLALGAVQQACERGLADALTGPVLRGDSATVERHIGALRPNHACLYRNLSQEALRLAVERKLPQEKVEALVRLLGTP
jgi:predicted short-subunit dehydrogenase-like oxidoreductase (DUF2520 family)